MTFLINQNRCQIPFNLQYPCYPGVQPVLSARDLSQTDVEHLAVMSWATQLRNVPPRPPVHDMLRVALDSTSGRVGETVSTTWFFFRVPYPKGKTGPYY